MKSIFLLLMLIISNLVTAQDYLFKVLATKGTNKFKNGSSVFTGTSIKYNDVLIVGNNSYVGLAHKTGKTLELREAGEYTINDLLKKLSNQNQSTVNKYVSYLAGEMSKTENEDMSKNRYKYMKVLGSVERAGDQIKINAPLNAQALDNIYLIWNPIKGENQYKIEIENLFGEKVFTVYTSDTILDLSIDSIKKVCDSTNNITRLKEILVIKITGEMTKSTSNIHQVSLPSENNKKIITSELDELNIDNTTSIGKLLLAFFYEKNSLFYDALKCYQEAIELSPDVEDYQIARGQFFERLNKNK